MKGLLIKDFRLLKMQKRFLLVLLAVALFMAFTMEDPAFLIGYLTFVLSFFSLSTISYDTFDNGSAFLFALPITRKLYVVEKYCFSLLLTVAAMAASVVLVLVFGAVKQTAVWDAICGAPAIGAVVLLFLAVMLPLQLKFGAEKSRIAMIAVGGAGFLLITGAVNLGKALGVDLTALSSIHPAAIIGVLAVLIVGAMGLSMHISIRIMEKKEF